MNPPNDTYIQRRLLHAFGMSYAELILNQQGMVSQHQEQRLQ
jgi:hypothetical protein